MEHYTSVAVDRRSLLMLFYTYIYARNNIILFFEFRSNINDYYQDDYFIVKSYSYNTIHMKCECT